MTPLVLYWRRQQSAPIHHIDATCFLDLCHNLFLSWRWTILDYFVCLSVLSTSYSLPLTILFCLSLTLPHYRISLWKGVDSVIIQFKTKSHYNTILNFCFVSYPFLNQFNFCLALLIATENRADGFYPEVLIKRCKGQLTISYFECEFNLGFRFFPLCALLCSYIHWFTFVKKKQTKH